MRFSALIVGSFLLAALVCGVEVFRERVLPAGTAALAASYCLLFVALIVASRGYQRSVMLIAGVAVLIGYISRLIWLLYQPEVFQFQHLMVLTSEDAARALAFMTAGTLAFWLGVRFAPGSDAPLRDTAGSGLLSCQRALILVGLGVAAIVLVVNVTVGIRWIGGTTAFLMRFLPLDLLSFTIMYVVVLHWGELERPLKALVVVFYAVVFVSSVSIGSRNAIVSALMPWLAAATLRSEVRIRPLVMLAALPLLAALPSVLGFVSEIRTFVRGDLATAASLPLVEVWGMFDLGFWETLQVLSNRMGSFDQLVAVLSYTPEVLHDYVTPGVVLRSLISDLLPNALYPMDVIASGQVFAVFYQGVSWEGVQYHSGSWSGFGYFYVYFGPLVGIVGLTVLGLLVTAVLPRLAEGSATLAGLASYFLYSFTFAAFVSGNMDVITSGFLIQALVFAAIMWAISTLRSREGTPAEARFAGDGSGGILLDDGAAAVGMAGVVPTGNR